MRWTPVPMTDAVMGDHRRYPLCRLLLTCALCGWTKGYSPERVIGRLQEQRTGGNPTKVENIRRFIGWNCPGCGRVKWRTQLAWPPGVDEREIKRLTSQLRS